MYCPKCGIHHADAAQPCQLCGSALPQEGKPESLKIFTDLTKYPFRAILHSLKSGNPLLALLALPFITLMYWGKKLTRQPFFSALLNSKTPKLHVTDIAQFKRLHQKSFAQAAAYFEQHGFTPLIDLEDVSGIQGNFQRFWFQREQRVYGVMHIHKATGKVAYITLFAITQNKTYLAVVNTYGVALPYPPNLIVQYRPNQPIAQIHQELLRLLAERQEEPRELPLKYLLPIGYNVRQISVERGLQHGVFSLNRKDAPAIALCYHHQTNVAVRVCATCQQPLCEACYTAYRDQVYCHACLPAAAWQAAPPVAAPGGYAGFGIRALATLVDLLVVALASGLVYFGATYGLRLLPNSVAYTPLALILTQLFVVVFTIFYFIVPLRKFGQTLGKKLLGVRVVDRHGNRPETVAAIVRGAYHLVAGLFVLPVLGYLFIAFRKTKQGLHDQLAGTFVVTSHPRRKALAAWLVLLALIGGGGWQVYQHIPPQATIWLSVFRAVLFGGAPARRMAAPEILLKPLWEHRFTEKNGFAAYIMRGEQCVIATAAAVQAVNLRTGAILWTAANLPGVTLYPLFEQNPALPLIVLQYQEKGGLMLLNLDPQTGAILWQQSVELDEEFEDALTVDARSIVVHGADSVSEYDLNGKLLWTSGSLQKRLQDQLVVGNVAVQQGILVQRQAAEAATLTYFERRTGKVLWEAKDSLYQLIGYAVGARQQILYTKDQKAMLLDLPAQKPLWPTPQAIGAVRAVDVKRGYLYTDTAAIRQKDGSVAFAYPPQTHFRGVSADFLIVLGNSPGNGDMLLLDKATGAVKKSFPAKFWGQVMYLTEDQATLYLAATLKPAAAKTLEIVSELVMLDKSTLGLREIPVGKNLGLLQFEIFPAEHLMCIPTYQQIGGYNYQ